PSQLAVEPGSVSYLQAITTQGQLIAPAIFREGYDCLIDPRYQDAGKSCGLTWLAPSTNSADRGAVTDLNGNLVTSSNPARLGQYLVLWATGLGSFAAKNGATVTMSNVPVYGFAGDTYYPIQTLYSGESAFSGVYQINTQVPLALATGVGAYPPPWPCGNYKWEVSLSVSVANQASNLIQIPVVVNSADIPGCK
ncbi:MAG TPA: hypothetical protein VNH18_36925, partial [Bryobacteraceae bacterium]|nr:hypothetical protein [Bryobacteraceae bacterium]